MTNQGQTNYVLIDFENIQPTALKATGNKPCKVYVFVGANDTKVSITLAAALQSLGEDAKYIKITGSGPNALDFHIAYYLGQLSLNDPKGAFLIVSKDKGFDPLIKHLNEKKIQAKRQTNLVETSVAPTKSSARPSDKVEAIIKNLTSRGQSRPRKVATLSNTINSIFSGKLKENELTSLINALKNRGVIVVNQEKNTYNLPK